MKERVPELDEYVDLMRKRALGQAPEMDRAKQAATIVRDRLRNSCLERLSVIDVGCATGHYLRSLRKAFPHADLEYVGIDIDPKMIDSANRVWSECSDSRFSTRFVCSGVDE